MSNKKRHIRPKTDASAHKKTVSNKDIASLLCFIAVTMVIFGLYRFLINHRYFEIVLIIYMSVAAACIISYVLYNRGFSRRGITVDMLPDDWNDEKKQEFIEDGKRRLKRSRPLLVLSFAFAFTFLVDIIELYCIPFVRELLGI